MLRIFLWRLIYHGLCLAKRLGFRGRKVFYFAYGGNLDPAVLKTRHIEAFSKEPYLLRGYELKFSHEIPFEGAAMATVEVQESAQVPGVVYEIFQIDALRLDCMEAHLVFNRYGKKWMKVANGRQIFFYVSNRVRAGLRPSKSYLQKLINGYRLLPHASVDFVSQLEGTLTVEEFLPKDPPYFLIRNYGNLLRPFLIRYDKKCVKVFASLIFKASPFEKT